MNNLNQSIVKKDAQHKKSNLNSNTSLNDFDINDDYNSSKILSNQKTKKKENTNIASDKLLSDIKSLIK